MEREKRGRKEKKWKESWNRAADWLRPALNMCCRRMLRVYCSRELEARQNINADSEVDLFALHHVFMSLLRREVEKFVDSLNHHKLCTEHNLTPLQLFITGLPDTESQSSLSSDDVR